MRRLLVLVLLLGGAAPPPAATNCSGCHGAAGIALTGRDPDELADMMIGFRSGRLSSTIMGRLMKGLSDDEIQAAAAWVAKPN